MRNRMCGTGHPVGALSRVPGTMGGVSEGRSGTPGRYQRSFGGLVGAMVVLVVVVLSIVGYRELFRTDAAVDPTPVDYLDTAESVATTGLPVVAPASLPQGWVATSADLDRDGGGEGPVWRVGMLTGDERFVGLRQGDRGPDELIETAYPDAQPEAGPSADVESPVAGVWETWRVDGELAYTATVEDTVVLVHGSAGEDALEETIGRLTRVDRAQPASSSPESS